MSTESLRTSIASNGVNTRYIDTSDTYPYESPVEKGVLEWTSPACRRWYVLTGQR